MPEYSKNQLLRHNDRIIRVLAVYSGVLTIDCLKRTMPQWMPIKELQDWVACDETALQKEETRANTEGLTEEELEIYDLLVAGKKLTKVEEQKVKLSAKNLYKKLTENKKSLFMIDWYKDEQPKSRVIKMVKDSLDADLPDAYDKISFNAKVDLLINHFVDMAVQGYGWVGAVA